jgi:hypothetical protein
MQFMNIIIIIMILIIIYRIYGSRHFNVEKNFIDTLGVKLWLE